MTSATTRQRLTIIVDEARTWHHKPIYAEIVHRAHDWRLAGASVFRGIEGFGASGRVHTNRILSLTERMPVMVVIIDTPEKIDAFLRALADLELGRAHGIVTLENVELVGTEELPSVAPQ